eukprot:1159533-Pelagomonas_calceolata.AAC.2
MQHKRHHMASSSRCNIEAARMIASSDGGLSLAGTPSLHVDIGHHQTSYTPNIQSSTTKQQAWQTGTAKHGSQSTALLALQDLIMTPSCTCLLVKGCAWVAWGLHEPLAQVCAHVP